MRQLIDENEWENLLRNEYQEGVEDGFQRGVDRGRDEGIEQGIEQGHEAGPQEGIEQGREETTQQLARSMLDKGIDPQTIAEVTGLSPQAIQALTEIRKTPPIGKTTAFKYVVEEHRRNTGGECSGDRPETEFLNPYGLKIVGFT